MIMKNWIIKYWIKLLKTVRYYITENINIDLNHIMYSTNIKYKLTDALINYTHYYNDNNVLNDQVSEDWKQWLVGFTDGEGSFRINIRNDDTRAELNFTIKLHVDDQSVLQDILNKLDVTMVNIHFQSDEDTCSISIGDRDILLNKVIPLFDKYPLLTKKRYDYMLWREAFFLNIDKSLVKTEKMNKIIQLKAKLNKYAKEDLFLYS